MSLIMLLSAYVFLSCSVSFADKVLIGDNSPFPNKNDGDFNKVWASWRAMKQPPFWTITTSNGKGAFGVDIGRMFAMCDAVAESHPLLEGDKDIVLKSGDILKWSFDADLEYKSNGSLSFSIVFGDKEHILVDRAELVGSDRKFEHFSGEYTIAKDDKIAPFLRIRFFTSNSIKVYIDNITIRILNKNSKNIEIENIKSECNSDGSCKIALLWNFDEKFGKVGVYRKDADVERAVFNRIGYGNKGYFEDVNAVTGKKYVYMISTDDGKYRSKKVDFQSPKGVAPLPVTDVAGENLDASIMLKWTKSASKDLAYYMVERSDADGKNAEIIADNLVKCEFEDLLAPKGKISLYRIFSVNFYGNKSIPSNGVKLTPNLRFGSSFSDLILPMPLQKGLRSDLWGASNVLPRDPLNGIEDSEWSYWGGCPVKGKDGKYHINVVRWPEKALKGHWEWPSSTVAYAVSDSPIGPYKVVREHAYDFKNGLGHNADIIKMNDGSYALYSLINWEPTIFISKSISGPWARLGIPDINITDEIKKRGADYQYQRNLSGVQLEDGSILMVSKFGSMMVSKNGLLGPYDIVTDNIKYNKSIPSIHRNLNYEDPVIWKDEVQFHMIINAFLAYRAIYLRSGDGIHWKYDSGLAYTPDSTIYENGVKIRWDKMERPHILQDEYGRATHLSLAVIDVDKDLDYGADIHNSKNLILPLTVHKRTELLGKTNTNNNKVRILLRSEKEFDAIKDTDIKSLKYGTDEIVNKGQGSSVIEYKVSPHGLILTFDNKQTGLTKDDYCGKLIGREKNGKLIISYIRIDGQKITKEEK